MQDLDGLPRPRRDWASAAVILAIAMAVLDGAVANTALPVIARSVHTTAATSIWIINAYQLTVAVSLLPMASLGDSFGHRRVYVFGLATFTLASAACALASGFGPLVAARLVQGIGASAVLSMNGALVRHIYPRSRLAHGVALNALTVACAAAAGPTVASAILSVATWPWLFAVNLPLGMLALGIAAVALPATPGSRRRYDGTSAVLNAGTLGFLIHGLESVARTPASAGAELVASLACGVILVRRSFRREHPLVPVDLLRHPLFASCAASSVAAFSAQGLTLVSLPFLLQALGHSEVAIGLLLASWPVGMAVGSAAAGRLADRSSTVWVGAIGLGLTSAGLLMLALAPAAPGNLRIVWPLMLGGFGFGLFGALNIRAVIVAAPRERLGAAGGVATTARLVGQSLGAASAALILAASRSAGTRNGLFVAAILALVAVGVSLTRLRGLALMDGGNSAPAGAGE
jgi:DHA2 family multidrug resistance protein-like MFS transporter